jgi:hypothetical protein
MLWRGGGSAASYRRRRNDGHKRMRPRGKDGRRTVKRVADCILHQCVCKDADTSIPAAHLFPFYPRMRHVMPRNATALSGISLPPHRINETIASVFCRTHTGPTQELHRSWTGVGPELDRSCRDAKFCVSNKGNVTRPLLFAATTGILSTCCFFYLTIRFFLFFDTWGSWVE